MPGLVCGDNLESALRRSKAKMQLTMDPVHSIPFEHENATKLTKYMGSLIRDKTPMFYETWSDVPTPMQNDIYHALEVSNIITTCCEYFFRLTNVCFYF